MARICRKENMVSVLFTYGAGQDEKRKTVAATQVSGRSSKTNPPAITRPVRRTILHSRHPHTGIHP